MGFYSSISFVFVTSAFCLSAYIWRQVVVILRDKFLKRIKLWLGYKMNICQEKMEKILQPIQSRNQRAFDLFIGNKKCWNEQAKISISIESNHIPLEFNKFSFLWKKLLVMLLIFYKLTLSLQSCKITFVSKMKGQRLHGTR